MGARSDDVGRAGCVPGPSPIHRGAARSGRWGGRRPEGAPAASAGRLWYPCVLSAPRVTPSRPAVSARCCALRAVHRGDHARAASDPQVVSLSAPGSLPRRQNGSSLITVSRSHPPRGSLRRGCRLSRHGWHWEAATHRVSPRKPCTKNADFAGKVVVERSDSEWGHSDDKLVVSPVRK